MSLPSSLVTVFRFKALDKMQALTLCHEVMDASYKPAVGSTDNFVGEAVLTEFSLEDINTFIVRQNIAIYQCEICLKVPVSDAIHFQAPPIVNQMLKHIDCEISIELQENK